MNSDTQGKGKQEQAFFPNHKVEYTYRHSLNSKSSTMITKRGIIKRSVRNRTGLQRPTGFYMVQFDGNKTLSKVHESKLKNLTINQ